MRYYRLRQRFRNADDRARVIDRLLALRGSLERTVPPKDADDNLLVATWNIRDLAKTNRRGYGKRLPESHFYIAEVLSAFDFIAVQEVNQLDEWEDIMDILGPHWEYLATDVTDISLGGNGERLTYVWDRRKVYHQNIAGEIVLPAHLLISKTVAEIEAEDGSTETVTGGKQFRRTPFAARFQSGWFKFDICTVHIYFGADSGDKLDQRVEEIAQVADYFANRADISMKAEGRSLILLGDFNIVRPDHKTMDALLDSGFRVPEALRLITNTKGDKYYDQIAFKTEDHVLEFIERHADEPNDRNAGVFKPFNTVFKTGDRADYDEAMLATSNGQDHDDLDAYYADWRTYQISDHNPLWARLQVNRSDAYLRGLRDAELPAPL
ncbi:MAG: endonuclease/exonuclease/phosphatase family protein [Acidimicrobiia bacterium]|nr:endonuclease/exonuclease/phosphatase family protein [Acidimicrobiia bacterium]